MDYSTIMKVGRKEQRKINCKAKPEIKVMVENEHKETQKGGETYGKLKKDAEHEKCERTEKTDVINCHCLLFNQSCFCVG